MDFNGFLWFWCEYDDSGWALFIGSEFVTDDARNGHAGGHRIAPTCLVKNSVSI